MLSVYTLNRNCVILCIIFTISINSALLHKEHNQINALENLLLENKPIVLVLNAKTQEVNNDFDNLFTNNDDGLETNEDSDDRGTEKSYAAHFLHHLLRTDSVDELDSSVEDTKQMLRSALRARCQKVDKCVKKCPPKRPSCPKKCQEALDEPNLCSSPPKPNKCKKPKCGKTMPPSWRF